MNDTLPVESLRTSFRILDLLSKNDGMTFSDVVEQLDLPNSTVYDHLQSLRRLRYVDKTGAEYRVSFEFLLIGDRRRHGDRLFSNARSVVDELAETSGEHASLFVEEDGQGRTVYTKQGANTVDFKVFDGSRSHLPFTAPGKAMLSTMDGQDVDRSLDRQGLLEGSATDSMTRAELHDELALVSEQGFAVDDQVAIDGMRGVAVPIIDKHGDVPGAISIYGPVRRLEQDHVHDELVNLLKTKKNVIELNLDYTTTR